MRDFEPANNQIDNITGKITVYQLEYQESDVLPDKPK